jgi:hypothetical protein
MKESEAIKLMEDKGYTLSYISKGSNMIAMDNGKGVFVKLYPDREQMEVSTVLGLWTISSNMISFPHPKFELIFEKQLQSMIDTLDPIWATKIVR